MKWFVTGAAGFIGSNLVDRLLSLGHEVVGYDNFSTGRREFLEAAGQQARFRLVEGDVLDLPALTRGMEGCETVAHLAANADVRFGTDHPRKDLEQNTLATWNVLEAMRQLGGKRLAFTSTGSIYGETTVIPTPEDAPLPIQTSLYGASKMAAEGLACAYAEGFGLQVFIFRFVSMLGHRYTHGHVFDFYRQLQEHPGHLHILGDGHQRKSYLDVNDCLDGVLLAMEKSDRPVNIFNVGADEYCEVNDSVGWITEHLGLSPKLTYSGGRQGWIGDNTFIFLDCSRLRGLGWKPKLTIRQGVIKTLRFFQAQPELMK
jgi:UDP-glucose 4-epimerase